MDNNKNKNINQNEMDFTLKEIEITKTGCKYKVKIKIPMSYGWIEDLHFVVDSYGRPNFYPMHHTHNDDTYTYFETEVELPTQALYHYYFSMKANGKKIYHEKINTKKTDSVSKEGMWKLSVNFKAPDWAKGKIIYHIFVDSYNRSGPAPIEIDNRTVHKDFQEKVIVGPDSKGIWCNDHHGGNFRGIIEKLDYIKSLGVSIIYLSPIVYAQSNHHYDAINYEIIDPYFGTEEDLKELCSEAHKKGIKIILDAVFNHTGDQSIYFDRYHKHGDGAYQNPNGKYHSFFTYDENGMHKYWYEFKTLPKTNCYSKEYQEYICGEGGIIDKWFSFGIDGLRLDVADELSDPFIELIRIAVKRNKPDGFIIGEVWERPVLSGRGYIESGKSMDTIMNYYINDAIIRYFKYNDKETIKFRMKELVEDYPDDSIYSAMNFTSTHDISRAINIFGCDEFTPNKKWGWDFKIEDREKEKHFRLTEEQYKRGKEIYLAYLYALAFFPGNLSIFYGDEIGMQGLGNLMNRGAFTWDKIDYDILNMVKWIGAMRNNESFLETAETKLLDVNDKYFSYERIKDNEKILVNVNKSEDYVNLYIPEEYQNPDIIYPHNNSNEKVLTPFGGMTLKKIKKF